MNFPKYITTAGLHLPDKDIGNGETQITVTNTNEKECRAYAAKLEAEGFVCCSARERSVQGAL